MKNYLKDGNQFISDEKLFFDRFLLAVFAQGTRFYYTSAAPYVSNKDIEWDVSRKGVLYRVFSEREGVAVNGWVPTWLECHVDGLSDTVGVSAKGETWQLQFDEDYWTGELRCTVDGDQEAANKWVEDALEKGTSFYQDYEYVDEDTHAIYCDFERVKNAIKHRRISQMMEAATDWSVLSTPLIVGKVKLSRAVENMIENATFHESSGPDLIYSYDDEPTDSFIQCSEGLSVYSAEDYMLVFKDIEQIEYQPDRQQLIGYFKNDWDAVAFRFANT
ncbi:hypothetical protein [Terasakiella pusilla]|uniref:hypothetical protein n=1 Tax=Terasakiella pusilla TaxID=64973 RepID=UPI00048E038D|nr:hypothetical protein [Terasakiella pusilla]